ncbi:AAA family ATPase [Aquabacterium sp. NJ1]|jgi:ATP-dependent Lon protease|uniref:AAA family ATPase n=1 Tax=Aquabacterium sp. NJ1 TaxID=1538295 RepID=UPI00068DBA49|nr:AAA family ATPase [Aquabacterium sp. NJ1]
MATSSRYRTMSRAAYLRAIAAMKARHPWLGSQVVEPAPGHMLVVEQFLSKAELLMQPENLQGTPLFCATTYRDRLCLRMELTNASVSRDRALLDLIDVSRHAAQQHCPVCGAPVIGGDANAGQGVRCKRHEASIGLFTEDIKRNRRLALGLGLLPAPAERVRSIRGEPIDPSVPMDEGVSFVVQTLHHETPLEPPLAPSSPPAARATPQIAFLDVSGLRSFVDRHRTKSEEKAKRAHHIAERIRAAGHERRCLGELPDDWPDLIDEFTCNFPNFAEVAEVLHDYFALHAMGDGRVSWSPLLLVGPAGIGKTEAARWLAERLCLPFRVMDMASAQSGSPLAGSESFWSNSEPGVLFELLAYQPKANPVVVLDELDKTDKDRPYDPLAALYTLLEPRSARSFIDLSIRDFSIDASHVNWIATANSADNIPAPLLSRMTVLQVQAPTTEHAAHIAQQIYGRMRAESPWGSAFSPRLDEQVVNQLKNLPPRSVGLAIKRALGRAAREERDYIRVGDLPSMPSPTRNPMGFTA